jgi:hypothetical protein
MTWKKIVELDRPQMTICHMRIACWIPRAAKTHSGCEILNAIPRQQRLYEHASVLHYTYIACLVSYVGVKGFLEVVWEQLNWLEISIQKPYFFYSTY